MRTALGAGKRRLVRQALTESLVLSSLAGTVGLLFAWIGTRGARTLAAGALPRIETVQLDLERAPVPAGGSARQRIACRAASGGADVDASPPSAARGRPARARRTRRRRLHQGLVVAEIALAVILLSGAGLLMRSFLRVQATDRGFDSSNVLLLQVDLPGTYDNAAKMAALLHRRDRAGSARCRAWSRWARSATSSSTVSRTTESRSTASRRSGPKIPRRR